MYGVQISDRSRIEHFSSRMFIFTLDEKMTVAFESFVYNFINKCVYLIHLLAVFWAQLGHVELLWAKFHFCSILDIWNGYFLTYIFCAAIWLAAEKQRPHRPVI